MSCYVLTVLYSGIIDCLYSMHWLNAYWVTYGKLTLSANCRMVIVYSVFFVSCTILLFLPSFCPQWIVFWVRSTYSNSLENHTILVVSWWYQRSGPQFSFRWWFLSVKLWIFGGWPCCPVWGNLTNSKWKNNEDLQWAYLNSHCFVY